MTFCFVSCGLYHEIWMILIFWGFYYTVILTIRNTSARPNISQTTHTLLTTAFDVKAEN